MTPDQVIKEAIETLAAAQHDAFVLGAYQTLKEAGATDEEATELMKLGTGLARKSKQASAIDRAIPLGKPHTYKELMDILKGIRAGRAEGHSSGLAKGLLAGGAGGLGVGALVGHKATKR